MLRRHFLFAVLAALPTVGSAQTQAPANQYSIRVTDMHCANCARKIAGKLLAVQGVQSVRTSVATHTATVTARSSQQPSNKALWEAVEKSGFKPVKLTTPSGEFTEKPKE